MNVCSLPRRSLRKCLVMLFFICRLSSSVVGSMTEYRYRRRNCFHRKSFCDLKMEKENRDDFSLLYGSKAKRFHEDPDQGAYYLCVLTSNVPLDFAIWHSSPRPDAFSVPPTTQNFAILAYGSRSNYGNWKIPILYYDLETLKHILRLHRANSQTKSPHSRLSCRLRRVPWKLS